VSFHKYTSDELNFLREHCRLPRKEMTARFNAHFECDFSYTQLSTVCNKRGWTTGRNGCFKKGVQVWNKGLKGFTAPGCEKGWFKKGTIPPRTRPILSERVTKDGYIEVKTDNLKRWQLKHHLVWREHAGAIPKSHVILFKDGNRQNCAFENLEMLPRALQVVLVKSGYYNEPEELKPVIRAQTELQMKINKIARS
jgi:hypothetical protein